MAGSLFQDSKKKTAKSFFAGLSSTGFYSLSSSWHLFCHPILFKSEGFKVTCSQQGFVPCGKVPVAFYPTGEEPVQTGAAV